MPRSYKKGYALVGELGRGAFGTTVLFRDVATREEVAVKFLQRGKQIADSKENVKREIKNHRLLVGVPSVVQFKEVLLLDEHLAIAMEYAAGGELFQRVIDAPGSRFSEDVARYFFQSLICGVGWCHSRGVYHRDLKLDNVLVHPDIPRQGSLSLDYLLQHRPRLKICDFGYSKASPLDSAPHTAVGTPQYMAPETFKKKEYSGEKADVWSCGVLLYATLTGTFPFDIPNERTNMLQWIERVAAGIFQIPARLHISPQCKDLLSKILEVDPDQRYSLAQIKAHSWFQTNLPEDLRVDPPAVVAVPVFSQSWEEISEMVEQACTNPREAMRSVEFPELQF